MKQSKSSVLLIVISSTFFTELFRVAKLLKKNNLEPVMLFYDYPTDNIDMKKCKDCKISCVAKKEIFSKKKKSSDGFQSLINRLKYLMLFIIWDEIINFYTVFIEHKIVYQIISFFKPSLIILAGDMVGYDSPLYTKIAHEKHISILITPSTMSNGLEQAEVYYYVSRQWCRGILRNIVGKLYPHWVRVHRGRKLLRESLGRLLALEWLGTAPSLPWIFNSGYADVITVESNEMYKYYFDVGLRKPQLVITGSTADDQLHSGIKNKNYLRNVLYNKLGLDLQRPMVLLALPPDSLYMAGGRPECDFRNYNDLINYWIQSISKVKGYNIVVCLHPSVNPQDYKYLETHNLKVSEQNSAELIPLCDIYVASVSSTIRWAIACGKPVINYDVYRYRYTDFLKVKGVITFEEKKDFQRILKKITSNKQYYQKLKTEQEFVAWNWGQLDGESGKRIMNEVNRLISRNT